MRELLAGRGGWSVLLGGPRFGCGVGSARGAEGGGIRELVLLAVERDGGRRCACDEDAGCTGSVLGVWSLPVIGWDWFVVPFMLCPGLPVSSFRFSTGIARIGGGTLDADALGVVSSVISSDSCTAGPASFPAGWGSVTASRASDLESGGGDGGGIVVQLRGE